MSLEKSFNIMDFRSAAKKRLPAPFFHYIDGGSDDEWTMSNNVSAFNKYELIPNYLRDIQKINLRTSLLGSELAMPLLLSPTGMTRLFHHKKELAVAQGCSEGRDDLYTIDLGNNQLGRCGNRNFRSQNVPDIHLERPWPDKGICHKVQIGRLFSSLPHGRYWSCWKSRARKAPRDDDAAHLLFGDHGKPSSHTRYWSMNFLLDPSFKLANVEHRVDAIGSGSIRLIDYVNSQFDRSVTWDDAAWLVREVGRTILHKGTFESGGCKACKGNRRIRDYDLQPWRSAVG